MEMSLLDKLVLAVVLSLIGLLIFTVVNENGENPLSKKDDYIKDYSVVLVYAMFDVDETLSTTKFQNKSFYFEQTVVYDYTDNDYHDQFQLTLYESKGKFGGGEVICLLTEGAKRPLNRFDRIDISGELSHYDSQNDLIFTACVIHND